MIHVYCFLPDGTELAELPEPVGVDGAEVRSWSLASLTVVASEHEAAPPPGREVALAHHEVVRSLGEIAPVLPVRFGASFADGAALAAATAPRRDELHALLHEVGRAVEYLVRPEQPVRPRRSAETPATDAAVTASAGGRHYLEARLDAHRAAERAVEAVTRQLDEVDVSLRPHAVRSVARSGPAGPERCYLVDRAAASGFVEVARGALARKEAELRLGGPLPPYTFADAVVPA